ncbi:hypothetical protein BGZ60DRAFT_416178 [Tricladium varicosporioides]|nr:hypothetical protein BGZ60DRAFT_416178 [Hymenoscyphus varicosporioides]
MDEPLAVPMRSLASLLEGIPIIPLTAPLRNLACLPRETIHQIMDDLPLVNILKILAHNNSYLNECVISHAGYQNVFPTFSVATQLTELFILHREICYFTGKALAGPFSPKSSPHLNHTYKSLTAHRFRDDLQELTRSDLVGAIEHTVYVHGGDRIIMEQYASEPYHPLLDGDNNSCSNLRKRWAWWKTALTNLNENKARQLNMLAHLISEYPGKVMLKTPLDPLQAGPRFNTDHIARRYKTSAKRLLVNRKLPRWDLDPWGNGGGPRCKYSKELTELIPYDRCLWSFLGTLERYPPKNLWTLKQYPDLSSQFSKLSINGDNKSREEIAYPEDIAKNLDVVMRGLMYIYTESPLLIIPRIVWPKEEEMGVPLFKKPVFAVDTTAQDRNPCTEPIHHCIGKRIRPHIEKEYDWLKAFLKVVAWMEQNPNFKGNKYISKC